MRALTAAVVAVTTVTALTAVPAADGAPEIAVVPARSVDHGPDPGRFHDPTPNPWFPLRPGTVWVLRGVEAGHRFDQRTTVTHRHETIGGVRTRVVLDVIRRADGSIEEKTRDWFASDHAGRVWYFGENTATYDRNGQVEDRSGSWRAGRDGAVAGLIMPARPRVTQAFRQEFAPGQAEDQAWITQTDAHVRTPAVSSRHAVRSFEWTRLEPGVVSRKMYVRGYGMVQEADLSGGTERFDLVRMHRPGR